MNASEFARKRARIERRAGDRAAFLHKAMAHLVREAGAVVVVVHGQVVGWRMKDGAVVCVKRRYADEAAAQVALVGISRMSARARTPVRVYRCGHCGGWHLTSQALNNNHAA